MIYGYLFDIVLPNVFWSQGEEATTGRRDAFRTADTPASKSLFWRLTRVDAEAIAQDPGTGVVDGMYICIFRYKGEWCDLLRGGSVLRRAGIPVPPSSDS
jgi:hypothetical protein